MNQQEENKLAYEVADYLNDCLCKYPKPITINALLGALSTVKMSTICNNSPNKAHAKQVMANIAEVEDNMLRITPVPFMNQFES